MPRLIHLNGPPGIGKSTIAARYVDDHSGTLNLDIDRVRQLVGGWRTTFAETGEIVRPVALAMATAHLRGGRDVVLPQFLGRTSEIERFEQVASASDAQFVEIVLMDSKEQALQRFAHRRSPAEEMWHVEVQRIVAEYGGSAHLEELYDQLVEVVASRPSSTVVHTEAGAFEAAYTQVRAVLD